MLASQYLQKKRPRVLSLNMSTAADNLADALAQTSLNDTNGDAHIDAAAASADEGRRLYIGNLAYATTEGQLKEFFNGYTM